MKLTRKMISLALALTLALCLVLPAAATYTDDSQIVQKEAVELLSALNILQGSNQAFQPKGILTREQAAKIIAMFHYGSSELTVDKAKELPFEDVAAETWSVPYISYCYENGLVTGTSETTFAPAAKLKGAAFLKMVLNVLGYDTQKEGFTGADWSAKVNARAAEASLTAGLTGFDANAALSRENAAQIMMNALKAYPVSYAKDDTVQKAAEPVAVKWDLKTENSFEYTDSAKRPGHKWLKISTGEAVTKAYAGAQALAKLEGAVTFHDMLETVGISDSNNDFVAFDIVYDGTPQGFIRDMCHFDKDGVSHGGCLERVCEKGTVELYANGKTHVKTDYLDADVALYRVVVTIG